jgi:hypothetical protein
LQSSRFLAAVRGETLAKQAKTPGEKKPEHLRLGLKSTKGGGGGDAVDLSNCDNQWSEYRRAIAAKQENLHREICCHITK